MMTLRPYALPNDCSANDHPAKDHPAKDRPTNDRPLKDRFRRRTILLVEDEVFVREATRGILESAGFEVLPSEDAAGAMRVHAACLGRIDLVMTDMILPGGTGQQLGRDLRALSPEIVVLVTSGYGNLEYTTETPVSHTYFLAKPYSKRTLLDKIETILSTEELGREATQAG